MIITSKKGKGNKIHISVDDEYRATVDADFWFSGTVRSGDEITEDELTALLDAVGFRRAYSRALDIISRRDHTKKELVQKLSQKVDKEIAIQVADKNDIESVSKQMVRLLETRHDAVGKDLYTATNFLQALDQVNNVL
ncbi:MAG: hypothetical protein RSD17_07635, partial [Oscillospiraceae bacterium]